MVRSWLKDAVIGAGIEKNAWGKVVSAEAHVVLLLTFVCTRKVRYERIVSCSH